MSFRINDLPPEVQGIILEHMTLQDLAASSQVCREWRDLTGDDLLWSKLFEQNFGRAEGNWRDRFRQVQQMIAFRNEEEIPTPTFSCTCATALVNWRPTRAWANDESGSISVSFIIDREGNFTENGNFKIKINLCKRERQFAYDTLIGRVFGPPIFKETMVKYSISPMIYVRNGDEWDYTGTLDYRENRAFFGADLEDNFSPIHLANHFTEEEQRQLLAKIRRLESQFTGALNHSIQKTVEQNLKRLSRFHTFESLGFGNYRARFLCDKKGTLMPGGTNSEDLIAVYFYSRYVPKLGRYFVQWEYKDVRNQMTGKEKTVTESVLNKTAAALNKKFGVTVTDVSRVENPGLYTRMTRSMFRSLYGNY